MGNESCERQTAIEFRCKQILPSVEKMDNPCPVATDITKIDQKEGSGNILSSPTPQKPEWRSKTGAIRTMKGKHFEDATSKDAQSEEVDDEDTSDGDSPVSEFSNHSLKRQIELPDKYKILANLFNRMDSSIRLLALRNKLPTFHNISTQVEILTRRKFLCSHLAQMKYVFPEAIHIEKILVHDPISLCMKPEMKISLVLDAVESPLDPDQSASMALCQAFSAKLLELVSTSSMGADIPEALLPEPFNRRIDVVLENTSLEGSTVEVTQQSSLDPVPLSRASHFASSFCRQISQKVIVPETQLTKLLTRPPSLVSTGSDDRCKVSSKSPLTEEKLCSFSAVKSPDKAIISHMDSQFQECTPMKHESSANELMMETPVLRTPQRAIPTPDEKLVLEDGKSLTETKSISAVRRSLNLNSSETDGSVSNPATCTTEQNKATECSCQQTATTKRSALREEVGGSSTYQLKMASIEVIKETEGHLPTQVPRGMRQQLLACLPSMFDTICLISQSLDYSSITKQELVHKIITNNLEIEETREVEEQLILLEELAPDWISKKAVSTGDVLYWVNGLTMGWHDHMIGGMKKKMMRTICLILIFLLPIKMMFSLIMMLRL